MIPEDMQEFMDINALYDDTVDLIVGGTIEKGQCSICVHFEILNTNFILSHGRNKVLSQQVAIRVEERSVY